MSETGFEYINGKKVEYNKIKDVKGDFNGAGNFLFILFWIVAILVLFFSDKSIGIRFRDVFVYGFFVFTMIFMVGSVVMIELIDGTKIKINKPFQIGRQKTIDHYKTLADLHADKPEQ